MKSFDCCYTPRGVGSHPDADRHRGTAREASRVWKSASRRSSSAGDQDRRTALWDLKDTGFFTSQLEEALLAGEADFAVHSFKDLPTEQREGLAVTAIYNRQWPEDCLLAKQPVGSLDELPRSARVGTSSLRRAAQLRHLRPDLELVPLRGNVQTRIRKLQTTDLDAIILARAGLERLGLADMISVIFDPRQFIPAPAQGAGRFRPAATTRRPWRSCSPWMTSGRAWSRPSGRSSSRCKCGCHAPVGAYAECQGEAMEIHAFIADVEGRNIIRSRPRARVARRCSWASGWPGNCSMRAAGRFFGNWKRSKAR